MVYLVQPMMELFGGAIDLPWPSEREGHAGPGETSIILQQRHLVPDDESVAQGRLDALRAAGVQTSLWWYADHPMHYQGDARFATAECGECLLDIMV